MRELRVRFSSALYSAGGMCACANTVRRDSVRGRLSSTMRSFGVLIILLRRLPAAQGSTVVQLMQVYFQPLYEFSVTIRRSKCECVLVMGGSYVS